MLLTVATLPNVPTALNVPAFVIDVALAILKNPPAPISSVPPFATVIFPKAVNDFPLINKLPFTVVVVDTVVFPDEFKVNELAALTVNDVGISTSALLFKVNPPAPEIVKVPVPEKTGAKVNAFVAVIVLFPVVTIEAFAALNNVPAFVKLPRKTKLAAAGMADAVKLPLLVKVPVKVVIPEFVKTKA